MPDHGRYGTTDLKRNYDKFCKKMLADGILTPEKIAEYTGLPLEEIKVLKAK